MMLRKGMPQQFQVFGRDQDGNEVPVAGPITWAADPAAGTITPAGRFTAGSTTGMYRSAVTASVPGGLSAVSVVEVVAPSPSGGFAMESSWGNFGAGHLNWTQAIAIGPSGSVYVGDYFSNRVQVFDSSGDYVSMWGSKGTSSTSHYLWYINGLATDGPGNVYAAEAFGISKFSPAGAYSTWIGGYGTGDGQFTGLNGIAVDASGCIYALDYELRRVQKFDSAGHFLLKWGSEGTANDQFTDPRSIAVSPNGRVYVTDLAADCVKVFGSDGSYITQWGGAGRFDSPTGVAVDAGGYVYVSDYDEDVLDCERIQKFDAAGNRLLSWAVTAAPLNRMCVPNRIAVDSSGNVYVGDSYNNSVHKYNSSGQLIRSWGSQCSIRGQLNLPTRVVVDGSGNTYVLGQGLYCIQKFDSQHNSVARWGTYGTGNGQFTYPQGIALGPDNCLYVVDRSACRVSVFDSSGTFLRKWGTKSYSSGGFWEPRDIAVDSNGIAYVCDTRPVVLRFTSQGAFLGEWSYALSGESKSPSAYGLAVDGRDYVYVADYANHRIKKFSGLGSLIMQFGTYGYGAGQLSSWDSMAFGPDGSVYVADANEIDVFDQAGNWVKQLGSFGVGPGQFAGVEGVAVDKAGNVFAADEGNNRIIKFVPQLSASDTAKAKSLPDGQFVSMTGQIVTAGSVELGSCFYIESANRTSGVKVTGKSASRGATASVDGVLATVNGEREIRASSVSTASGGSLNPLGMSAGRIGGGQLGLQGALLGRAYTGFGYELAAMGGLNNVGLLVRVWGKVRSVDTTGRTFMLSDGSALDLKCSVPSSISLPAKDRLISVTGISSTESSAGSVTPLLRVRVTGDIATLN